MKKILAILLPLSICLQFIIPISANESEIIPINEETFPDEKFRAFALKNGTSDGYVGNTIKNMTTITLKGQSISSLKGIEYFENVVTLDVSNNYLTELNLSHNLMLQKLYCEENALEKIVFGNNIYLKSISAFDNLIKDVDIRNLPSLEKLSISSALETIDLSNNPKLKSLYIIDQKMISLDLRNNTDLEVIDCILQNMETLELEDKPNLTKLRIPYGKLKTLNISECPNLMELNCNSNYLYTLDVRNNPLLNQLFFTSSKMVSLKLLDKEYISNQGLSSSHIINIAEKNTFNLKELDPEIEKENIIDVTGATLNDTTLTIAVPNSYVTYKYKANNTVELNVEIYFSSKVKNEWIEELSIQSWTVGDYDPLINKPKAKAKYGLVRFTYSDQLNGQYSLSEPWTPGTYYVKATVLDTKEYSGLEAIQEYQILPGPVQNTWVEELSIEGWVEGEYNESINAPKATAKYGVVTYSYSDKEDGVYSSLVPSTAGTYYVKATVEETEIYTGLENIRQFTIGEKEISEKAQNEWTQPLTIEGWEEGSYNMLINAPKATAKYGAVSYTYSDKVNGIYSKS
ncbi:MAG: leucine-rich repeat domain-containing protein, partial [Coprobacillaceae bacterium]